MLGTGAAPAPATWPSLISRWIWDREWSGRTETRKRSSRCRLVVTRRLDGQRAGSRDGRSRSARAFRPPAALRARWASGATPARYTQHHDRQRHEQDRDELRRREDADHAALVAAVELDDEARDAVEQHVEPERPPGERPALVRSPAAGRGSAARRRPRRAASGAAARRAACRRWRPRTGCVNVIPHGMSSACRSSSRRTGSRSGRRRGRARFPARTRRTSSTAAGRSGDVPERDDDRERSGRRRTRRRSARASAARAGRR